MVRQVLIAGTERVLATGAVVDVVLTALVLFVGCAAGAAALRGRGRRRHAWIAFTVGLGGWFLGQLIWTISELLLGAPPAVIPTAVDVAGLLYPIGACVGLLLLSGQSSWRSWLRLVLDGAIMGLAVFALAWVAVLKGAAASELGQRASWFVLLVPIANVVLVAIALSVLARVGRDERAVVMFLTVGNILGAVANGAVIYLDTWGVDVNHRIVGLGWGAALISVLLAAFASWRRSPRPREAAPPVPPRWASLVPTIPLAIATVICGIELLRHSLDCCVPMLVTSVLLIAVAIIRQAVTFNENRRLRMAADDLLRHDQVTGLVNAVALRDHLARALPLLQQDDQALAVLRLDVSELSLVTAACGRASGDELLVLVAGRIRGHAGNSDIIARLNGGQFAVVMAAGIDECRQAADNLVRAFTDPFMLGGRDLLIRPSIGLAVATVNDRPVDADILLARAEAAVEVARFSQSRNVCQYAAPGDADVTKAQPTAAPNAAPVEAVRLLGQLREAIDREALCLYYQPKYDLQSGGIIGVEALLRWQHPEHGLLGPDRFLPLVRSHGLTSLVNDLVINQALDDLAEWRSQGAEISVAINVFANCLTDIELPDRIAGALEDRRIPATDLTLEITEDFMMGNLGSVQGVLNTLRRDGVRVALDDFGSGYSTLSYLRDLPVDEVKLDRQFVASIVNDERTAEIVHTVVTLAHNLGAGVVAEGVENRQTVTRLQQFNCDIAQGYLFSPPIAFGGVLPWLRRGPGMSSSTTSPVGVGC